MGVLKLLAILAIVMFSRECSMHIDLVVPLCAGKEGDWGLRFLIVLNCGMLEDKNFLSVGRFDRLHFVFVLHCKLC